MIVQSSLLSRTIFVVSLLAVAACSTTPPVSNFNSPTGYPAQPNGTNITFQWIETPDFDPLSSDATFVRAYVESYEHARNGQSTDWGYPGFVEASPENIKDMILGDDLGLSFTGTLFYRPLKVESGVSSTTYILCRYGFTSYPRKPGWEYAWWPPRAVTLDLNKDGVPPPAKEKGPERSPHNNVFGDWKVTYFDYFARELPGWPASPEVRECEKDLSGLPPAPATELQQLPEPKPPLPPSPGWPGTGM